MSDVPCSARVPEDCGICTSIAPVEIPSERRRLKLMTDIALEKLSMVVSSRVRPPIAFELAPAGNIATKGVLVPEIENPVEVEIEPEAASAGAEVSSVSTQRLVVASNADTGSAARGVEPEGLMFSHAAALSARSEV